MRDHLIGVSRLSELEVTSALCRRCREGDFSAQERDRALTTLQRDLGSFFVVELAPEVLRRAAQLLVDHPLRTGDALQLGACLELRDRLRYPTTFITFDDRLLAAARGEALAALPD